MTRTDLCLFWAVASGFVLSISGCNSYTQSGPPNDVVFFGRLDETYEVCFNVEQNFEMLAPSTVCDREGKTAFSFNVEVQEGTDPNGDPCTFNLAIEDPIPMVFDEDQQNWQFIYPVGVGINQASVFGAIQIDSGAGQVVAEVTIGAADEEETVDCTVVWNASTDPVCRNEAFERCDLLASCCDLLYLLPPELAQCEAVVTACDPFACDALLTGYTQCPQPPICTMIEDPEMECQTLYDCCSTAYLDKDDLVMCLDTAEACDPDACATFFADTPECTDI